uniref:Uncharacterized protein n=1 Tax=Calcidiscus leptoporus TaxID=127549 RepID=A0A7S0IZ52_9EUKA|mmetsp:Transcript_30371/g.70620  ORF Transcript_30371/g.70620 Transcript_30371/m.70620 type:complete len:341 (+) Transcript_30371:42-1064(+)
MLAKDSARSSPPRLELPSALPGSRRGAAGVTPSEDALKDAPRRKGRPGSRRWRLAAEELLAASLGFPSEEIETAESLGMEIPFFRRGGDFANAPAEFFEHADSENLVRRASPSELGPSRPLKRASAMLKTVPGATRVAGRPEAMLARLNKEERALLVAHASSPLLQHAEAELRRYLHDTCAAADGWDVIARRGVSSTPEQEGWELVLKPEELQKTEEASNEAHACWLSGTRRRTRSRLHSVGRGDAAATVSVPATLVSAQCDADWERQLVYAACSFYCLRSWSMLAPGRCRRLVMASLRPPRCGEAERWCGIKAAARVSLIDTLTALAVHSSAPAEASPL